MHRQPESYAVEMENGKVIFIEATRARVWFGRLLFWEGLRLVGAVERGQWGRFAAGLTPDDLRNNEQGG